MKNAANKNKRTSQRRTAKAGPGKVIGFYTPPTLIPPFRRGKMSACVNAPLPTVVGAAASYVVRLNDVYDPDYTGTGLSAAGYTQMAGLYQRYRVLAATAHIQYIVNQTDAVFVHAVCSTVSTITVDPTRITYDRFAWTKSLSGIAGVPICTHKIHMPMHRLWGVSPKTVLMDDQYASAIGGGPTNRGYLHVGGSTVGSVAGGLIMNIRLEYDVLWYCPFDFA